MTSQAQVKPEVTPTSGVPPKRRMRNFLLQPRFQLKYTLWVVSVTVATAAVLGYFAYDYSRGQSEIMTVQMASQPGIDPAVALSLEDMAAAEDRKVLTSIVLGILFLVLILGVTGIMVTHRLVGPAFKLRLLMNHISAGHLRVRGKLRKGDELQDVFLSFERMIESLRERKTDEIEELDLVIHAVKDGDEAAVEKLTALRERMQAELK